MKNRLHFRIALLVATTLLTTGTAQAACSLAFSANELDLGKAIAGALAAASTPGYRTMGSRNVTLNGTCDAAQPVIRLAFTGLQQVPGMPLVQWSGQTGAMAFRIESATVGGATVAMRAVGERSVSSTPLWTWCRTAP